jgi:hypothetical protein
MFTLSCATVFFLLLHMHTIAFYNLIRAQYNWNYRYGYVVPDDVPVLLHKHIGQGEVVDRLWRYPPF